MTTGTAAPGAVRRRAERWLASTLLASTLLASFGLAVGLRVAVAGPGVQQSPVAGLVFAAALLVLVAAARTRVAASPGVVLAGVAGAGLLCVPATLGQLAAGRPLHGATGFGRWAAVVVVVAIAEELFLRGSLHDAVVAATPGPRAGPVVAVTVGAVCFALLHVPLYGWSAVPLDVAVGLVLGGLRVRTGSPAAPAVAHAGADLAAWFIR